MSRSNPWDDDDDDDDDRPRRRRRSEGYDEDGDYRGRDYAQDDYDDMPRRVSNPGTGLGIASMVCGIIAIVGSLFGCCCMFGYIGGGILGVLAIILGFVSRSQGGNSGFNTTGIITGFVSILLAVVLVILRFAFHFQMANGGF